ncbi:MAG: hypothetical protein R2705_07485 [Ilumatobacteraceae bacterium]
MMRGFDRATVDRRRDELLAVLGLTEDGSSLVADYSTGMRKKIALARGPAARPCGSCSSTNRSSRSTRSRRTITDARRLPAGRGDRGVLQPRDGHRRAAVRSRRHRRRGSAGAGRLARRSAPGLARGRLHRRRRLADGGHGALDWYSARPGPPARPVRWDAACRARSRAEHDRGISPRRQLSMLRAVRLGASLRWSIARNRLRKGGMVLFVLVVVLAVLAGLGGLAILGVMRSADPEDRRNLYVIAAVMVSLGWTFAPLTAGGADETVDPTRLALLPLSRRQLLGVLFGAAASSPATLAALVGTAGFAIGTAGFGLVAPIAIVAWLATFAGALGLARLVSAVLVRAQRSRKGRDIAIMVSGVAGVTLWLALQAVGPMLERSSDTGRRIVDLVSWLPPAWGVDAALAAAEGRTVAALGWLVGSIGWAALVLGGWATLTGRLLASPERTVAKQHVRGAPPQRSPHALLPGGRQGNSGTQCGAPSRRFNSSSAR